MSPLSSLLPFSCLSHYIELLLFTTLQNTLGHLFIGFRVWLWQRLPLAVRDTSTSKGCTIGTAHTCAQVRFRIDCSLFSFNYASEFFAGPNAISVADLDAIMPILGAKGMPRGESTLEYLVTPDESNRNSANSV